MNRVKPNRQTAAFRMACSRSRRLQERRISEPPKDGLTTDKAIQIDVIQASDPDNFSDVFRYKVEIGGIDVSR